MPFNLLLLPLLGGFWFVALSYRFQYSVARQSGERLLIVAATAGVFLAAASWVLMTLIVVACPKVHATWQHFVPWRFSGTALLAFILGPIAALIWNRLVDQRDCEEKAIEKYGSGLDRLFLRATNLNKQIMVTLDDRKVYVGWIVRTPGSFKNGDSFIRILPTLSGYRTDQHAVEFTTMYDDTYEAMLVDGNISTDEAEELRDYVKSLAYGRVVSAGIFDPVVYRRMNEESSDPQPIT